MMRRSLVYGCVAFFACVAGVYGVIAYYMASADDVTVAFLDVGQGDAILIMHGTHQILIDGGANQTVLLEALGRVMPFWDRTIEVVIATHPDADHIDGLIGAFTHYTVKQFWHTAVERDDSSVFTALAAARAAEPGVEVFTPYAGSTIAITDFARLEVVYPIFAPTCATAPRCDANANSIATLVTVGATTFYMGGDLPSTVEDTLVLDTPITVVKAGHHGARSSTSAAFLARTAPRDVIVSAGADNRYGHPHRDTLDRIAAHGARVFRTDQDGTIMYRCTPQVCHVATGR